MPLRTMVGMYPSYHPGMYTRPASRVPSNRGVYPGCIGGIYLSGGYTQGVHGCIYLSGGYTQGVQGGINPEVYSGV